MEMHFAIAVVTNDKPTESMLADALAPFGPAGGEPKWDWFALGGRFSGHLFSTDMTDTITGGPEYPDDELSVTSFPVGELGYGVDAVQCGSLEAITSLPVGVVFDGCWHATRIFIWQGPEGRCSPYLADIDPAAPYLPWNEGLLAAEQWSRRFREILEGIPSGHWISIVDCRAPPRAPCRDRP
jgi:hypothetical protein